MKVAMTPRRSAHASVRIPSFEILPLALAFVAALQAPVAVNA